MEHQWHYRICWIVPEGHKHCSRWYTEQLGVDHALKASRARWPNTRFWKEVQTFYTLPIAPSRFSPD